MNHHRKGWGSSAFTHVCIYIPMHHTFITHPSGFDFLKNHKNKWNKKRQSVKSRESRFPLCPIKKVIFVLVGGSIMYEFIYFCWFHSNHSIYNHQHFKAQLNKAEYCCQDVLSHSCSSLPSSLSSGELNGPAMVIWPCP